jgi:hypothetical protein
MAQPAERGTTSGDRVKAEANSHDLHQICAVLQAGHSALVLGESGTAIDQLPLAVYEQLSGELDAAIVTYKGSVKTFLVGLAKALDIPTEIEVDEERSKPMSVDQLKEEIAHNVSQDTLLILPEAKRLTTSIRYWLEDLISSGVRLCCFAPVNPGRDIFLDMIEVELSLPSDAFIRVTMAAEAQRLGVQLSESRLAELQPLAGRNPMLARKVVRQEKLGLRQDKVQHTQYVVMMPVIVAALFSFAVVRFVGMGTDNKSMYILGGVCMTSAMALKQLGNVRGARKRLGQ